MKVTDGASRGTTRETRGFVWWVASLAFIFLYVVWIVIPSYDDVLTSSLCHLNPDGTHPMLCRVALVFIYVFPDKYWITAIPALISVLLLLFVVLYCGLIIQTSVAPTSRAAWRSDHEPPFNGFDGDADDSSSSDSGSINNRDKSVMNSRKRLERQDIPLQVVSAAMHLD